VLKNNGIAFSGVDVRHAFAVDLDKPLFCVRFR
jgi:hypothetical protein